jgi:DNA polymerase-3 subunit delta'
MSVFDSLVGQDAAVEELRRAAAAADDVIAGRPAAAGAMTHAWLFTGPPGSGRSVAARALAAALECANGSPESGPGCGHCASCHMVSSGTHPDVRSIVPDGLSIGVDEARAVVAGAARRPTLGRWQVVVIEDADRLTESASNAILKAIEEPPDRTVFLLCAPSTHPDDIIVTIRSRCRVVPLRIPPAAAIAQVLRADGIDEATALWAAQAAQGHIGRAKRLARDEEARDRRAAVLAIPSSLDSLEACFEAADHLVRAAEGEAKSLTETLDAAETEELTVALGSGGTGKGMTAPRRGTAGVLKDLEKRQKSRATRLQRDALDRALVDLATFYRDVLLYQAGAHASVTNPDFARDVSRVARSIDSSGALKRLDSVLACRVAIEQNVKPRIAIEALTTALRLP